MENPRVPDGRAWVSTAACYGGVSSYGVWKLAIDAYYWDRLEQAYGLALELGVAYGWQEWFFRLIQAEAVTRGESQTLKIDEQLSLEYVPSELHHVSQVAADIGHACAEVRSRFGWNEDAKTLIAILAEETDAPWTVGRAGYMMDKYPYDKICLPRNATHTSREFQSAIRHEYAHVMVLNLSQGKAAMCLHEAITMLAQDWCREEDWSKFAASAEPWLDPVALTAAFDDQHDPSRFQARSLAYSQSAALGFYLKSLGGETKIGELLRAFADNSNLAELKMALTGQSPADEALRQVYGFGERELFANTLNWLRKA